MGDDNGVEAIGVFARLKPVHDKASTRGDISIKQRFGKAKAVQASLQPLREPKPAAAAARMAAADGTSPAVATARHKHGACVTCSAAALWTASRSRQPNASGAQPGVCSRLDLPRYDPSGGNISDRRARPRRSSSQRLQRDPRRLWANCINRSLLLRATDTSLRILTEIIYIE